MCGFHRHHVRKTIGGIHRTSGHAEGRPLGCPNDAFIHLGKSQRLHGHQCKKLKLINSQMG